MDIDPTLTLLNPTSTTTTSTKTERYITTEETKIITTTIITTTTVTKNHVTDENHNNNDDNKSTDPLCRCAQRHDSSWFHEEGEEEEQEDELYAQIDALSVSDADSPLPTGADQRHSTPINADQPPPPSRAEADATIAEAATRAEAWITQRELERHDECSFIDENGNIACYLCYERAIHFDPRYIL